MTGRLARFTLVATLAAAAALTGLTPASADAPTLLGSFKSWSAFQMGTGDSKVCYVLSQPKSSLPKKAKRDPVFFLISDWPGRKAKGEPEVVPGYLYKEGAAVTAQIGSDKFAFFSKNDGDSGSAWVKDLADEQRLVDALRGGSQMFVTGVSAHGTLTRDTYSLAGVGEALDRIHVACVM
jgi:hypothetical protein